VDIQKRDERYWVRIEEDPKGMAVTAFQDLDFDLVERARFERNPDGDIHKVTMRYGGEMFAWTGKHAQTVHDFWQEYIQGQLKKIAQPFASGVLLKAADEQNADRLTV
jgi:hypothetical protein